MGILDKLRGMKTATDHEAAIPGVEQELAAAEAHKKALEDRREAAIFDGGERDIDTLEGDIAAAEKTITTLRLALDAIRRRHGEAVERERQAEVEAKMAEAGKAQKRLRILFAKFAKLAVELAAVVSEIRQLKQEVANANVYAHANGRPDLVISDVTAELAEASGRLVGDPTSGVVIPGYYPTAGGHQRLPENELAA